MSAMMDGESTVIQRSEDEEKRQLLLRILERHRSCESGPAKCDPIAIVGLSGRYPMAETVDELWELLREGRDATTEVPAERWGWQALHDSREEPGASSGTPTRWGCFLRDVDKFDAAFFNISPREAETIDPQERLFLETAWSTFEDAGLDLSGGLQPRSGPEGNAMGEDDQDNLERGQRERIGVFVGVMNGGYSWAAQDAWGRGARTHARSAYWSIANRVSYQLNLSGPSMAVDSACSSSITALHLACESLRRGESTAALAGGVNLILHPLQYQGLARMKMLSAGGTCRPFGAGADGFVAGEGVGAVLLKPLSRALADRDRIWAVILGTAINAGGKTGGFTVPNPRAQQEVCARALAAAAIPARTVTYVEAHGTGTALGDPIEILALGRAYGGRPADVGDCAIGSLKSNIGHLESAAGIAGLTKVLLQMREGMLAPSLHADALNPLVDFSAARFEVQRALAPWPPTPMGADGGGRDVPRRAGVSSFGAGGANAHVVLQEYAAPPEVEGARTDHVASPTDVDPMVFLLSAKDPERLRAYAGRMAAFLDANERARSAGATSVQLRDIVYTTQVGRQAMPERLALAATDSVGLARALAAFTAAPPAAHAAGGLGPVWSGRASTATVPRIGDEDRASYLELARRWVAGEPVVWERVWHGRPGRRASIPTYPFARTRYWVGERAPEASRDGQSEAGNVNRPKIKLARPSVAHASSPITVPELVTPPSAREFLGEARAESSGPAFRAPEQVLRDVKAAVALVLYCRPEELDEEKSFLDLGFDSILMVELVKGLNRALGTTLKVSKLYDHPSVRRIAAHLASSEADPLTPSPAPAPSPPLEALPEGLPAADAVPSPARRAPEKDPRSIPASATKDEPIAVIGFSGRFPGAQHVDEYWANLAVGRDCVSEIPPGRWEVARHFHRDPKQPDKSYSKWGGFLSDIDRFDPLFFGVSPTEAAWMDPQQRLFLEQAFRAFEHAGYSPESLSELRCATFVGVMNNDYARLAAVLGGGRNHALEMMGSSNAILAARIAYLLNLKGPAVALDTACSSSLVASHLAIQSLRAGEADLALAGGVTLYLIEDGYIQMCKAGMLSREGRCKTFDDSADGFVPGEAVGAVVLKRLSDARADGDHIHGVILSSGVNQDGKTNGIAAPSAASQTALELEVYRRAGVSPDTITYVEAHGTGTQLGDAIEIDALSDAFRRQTDRVGFCAIGSVKSNLGHTSAAAGVCGLIKILLCFRHAHLPPSLHYLHPNSKLSLGQTPFFVNTELRPWQVPAGTPRRAALSGFGFSGTNAHLLLEEAPAPVSAAVSAMPREQLIVLSARTAEALQSRASELALWLGGPGAAFDLVDIAYTLQVGRGHHRLRRAFVVASHAQLIAALESQPDTSQLPGVEVEPADDQEYASSQVAARLVDELAEATSGGPADRSRGDRLRRLGALYASGCAIRWSATDGIRRPLRRVPLPTYPFADERYWLPQPPAPAAVPEPVSRATGADVISDASATTAATMGGGTAPGVTRWYASDALLDQHRIRGQRVLPATAYLELARAAHAAANGDGPVVFRDVSWVQPWIFSGDEGTLWTHVDRGVPARFEVRSAGDPTPVHCRGQIAPAEPAGPSADAPRVSVDAVRARCPRHWNATEIYRRFADIDVAYGPAFRGLGQVWSGADEALGQLELGPGGGERDRWGMSPLQLDSALQTVAALAGADPGPTAIPFALSSLRLYRPWPTGTAFVHARAREALRYDLTVCDEEGRACVVLQDLRLRRLPPQQTGFLYEPAWIEEGRSTSALAEPGTKRGRGVVLSTDDDLGLGVALAAAHRDSVVTRVEVGVETARHGANRWLWRSTDTEGAARWLADGEWPQRLCFVAGIQAGVSQDGRLDTAAACSVSIEEGSLLPLFHMVKALASANLARRSLELTVVTADAHPVEGFDTLWPPAALLHGFCKSLAREYSWLHVKCLDVSAHEARADPQSVAAAVLGEVAREAKPRAIDAAVEDLALRGGRSYVRRLRPVTTASLERAGEPLRDRGVYMIVGGGRGIGLSWAGYLSETHRARLVLVGRSAPDDQLRERIAALEARGGEVVYERADVTDLRGLRAVVARTKTRWGAIHGAVHSALVLRDASVERLDWAAFGQVLACKVRGSLVLYRALADEPLDFLLYFSSVQSFTGNPGQSSYAAASTFQDALALDLARRSRFPVKVVNWGYWGSVGAVTDPRYRRAMASRGVHSIEVAEGMSAIRAVLGGSSAQVVALKADASVLRNLGVLGVADPPASPPPPASPMAPDLSEIHRVIVRRTSEALGVSAAAIDGDVPFSDYGVDSITGTGMIEKIGADLGVDLAITAVFDHTTVAALALHLRERLQQAAPTPPVVPGATPAPKRGEDRAPIADRAVPADAIAIIGSSGRFPGAPDLATFWHRIAKGDDLVTEVPRSRWDIDRFYDADPRNLRTTTCRRGGFIDDVDCFDPGFFNMAGREADLTDPQQRLFLEESWKALENAGYAVRGAATRRCGVFVGVETGDYHLLMERAGVEREAQATWGNDTSILPARISYFLDLKGPSIAVNTACSSSLVALHLACQSLLTGESTLALAGGVYIATTPNFHVCASNAGMLSVDGRCKSFSDDANGFVPGEGVGVVVLKSLAAALRDGDTIQAVIRRTGVNQDGRTNGITTPSAAAQTELEASVYQTAGVSPETITYVEAHGSATRLGDPIEVRALTEAFGQWTDKTGFCAIGSVKANIGHAIAAAGIAGLLKVILSLRHRAIPPAIGFDRPNAQIDFARTPFYVNTRLIPWPASPGAPLRAAISSFGFSGTNAHVLVEEPPPAPAPLVDAPGRPHLLPLSAKTPEALMRCARQLAEALRAGDARHDSGSAAASRHAHDATGAEKDAAEASIREVVVSVAAGVLGVEAGAIDPDLPLAEQGLNPVELALVTERVASGVGIEQTPRLRVFGGSPSELARALARPRSDQGAPVSRDGEETLALSPIPGAPLALADVAYTLQVGREPMPERLAVVVATVAEAAEALERFASASDPGLAPPPRGLVRGRAEVGGAAALLVEGRPGEAFLRAVLDDGDLERVARLWVLGAPIDWGALHERGDDAVAGRRPRRIPLPVYPFARERRWITGAPPIADPMRDLDELAASVPPPPARDDDGYERIVALTLLEIFRRMGVFVAGGERYRLDDLTARLGVAAAHLPLFRSLLDLAARAGFVRLDAERAEVWAQPILDEAGLRAELDGLSGARQRLSNERPDLAPLLALLWACALRYPEALRGQLPATDLLFPGGSMDLVAAVYAGHPVADYFNQLTAESAAVFVDRRIARKPGFGEALGGDSATVRLLEIGAGTGSVTGPILRALERFGDRVRYTFTDVSTSFLQSGRSRFNSSRVEFEVLDIERDIREQSRVSTGAYDLVVAANVLHATRDVRAAVRHARALLRPGGWLVLSELTAVQPVATLTFGLLPGWWRFEDAGARLPGSPLVSADGWCDILRQEGFARIRVLPSNAVAGSTAGQSVIVAEWGEPDLAGAVLGETAAARGRVVTREIARASLAPAPTQAPVMRSPAPGGRAAIERIIAECIEEVVKSGAQQLDPRAPFQDFGIDSIFAVSIVERINQALSIALRTTDLFNFVTIDGLAAHIAASRGQDLGAAVTAPVPAPGAPAPLAPPLPPADDGRAAPSLLELLSRVEGGALGVEAVETFLAGSVAGPALDVPGGGQ